MFDPLKFPWKPARRGGLGKERRVEMRKPVCIPVQITLGCDTVGALLEDLNPGGTKVRLACELTPGQPVYVRFPAGINRATCRWSRPDAEEWIAGLEFAKDPALDWELTPKF